VVKYMADEDMPMDTSHGPLHFTEGTLAYAGMHLHIDGHPMHTHRFVEVAFVTGGSGTHASLAGRRELTRGDVVLLRPGVWHRTRCSATCSGTGRMRRRAAACWRSALSMPPTTAVTRAWRP
jgi:hypothetical protein